MEEDIQLTPELLDEIVKEAYKQGVQDAQEKKRPSKRRIQKENRARGIKKTF